MVAAVRLRPAHHEVLTDGDEAVHVTPDGTHGLVPRCVPQHAGKSLRQLPPVLGSAPVPWRSRAAGQEEQSHDDERHDTPQPVEGREVEEEQLGDTDPGQAESQPQREGAT